MCLLSDGRLVCVEIQLYEEKAHAKRIMTYTSGLIKTMCDRGDDYKTIKDVIVIYLTEKDIFKKGSTVYNVEMNIISDRNEKIDTWDAGFKVYYINTEGLTNKTINEYLHLLKDSKSTNVKYPAITETKNLLTEFGGVKMSERLREIFSDEMNNAKEEGIRQGMKQAVNALTVLINKGVTTIVESAKSLGISEAEFRALMPA